MSNEEKLWCAGIEEGMYQNPIIFADYSDPDVIRVDDKYYMTASSFNYVPGLPILVSKDLINWQLVNYATGNINYPGYEIAQHSRGVWAPAIRYHNGRFYIYYGMPDEGIFMVSAEDALGKWEEPVLVLAGKGLIDPCPIWEEDGSAYIIHGYANSRIGFKSHLGIFPMNTEGTMAVGEDHILYCGLETNPTIEGPKVYKRNGYYYIFAPAGGVKNGWQTILRSRDIKGPFEEMKVLHQGGTKTNGPHQGGWVESPQGENWFIHFQHRGMYGRIIHMQPVTWKDDWPVMGENYGEGYLGEPVETYERPKAAKESEDLFLKASDDFDSEKLNLMWQWQGNFRDDFYSLKHNPGHLRLFCKNPAGDENITLWRSANILTQKIVCPFFKAKVVVQTAGLRNSEPGSQNRAGIAIMGGTYAYLALTKTKEGFRLSYGVSIRGKEEMKECEMSFYDFPESMERLMLTVVYEKEGERPLFRMGYVTETGEEVTAMASYAFQPDYYNWVGAKLGLFAVGEDNGVYADFEYIHVSKIEKRIN